jgi:hypothetical protein
MGKVITASRQDGVRAFFVGVLEISMFFFFFFFFCVGVDTQSIPLHRRALIFVGSAVVSVVGPIGGGFWKMDLHVEDAGTPMRGLDYCFPCTYTEV